MKKIVLIGYMGSGKTEIGRFLSKKLELPFLDMDFLIENELGKTVSEIFTEKGEVYFRKIEHQIFKQQIENNESYILSTGGGTPCYANNHLLLNSEGVESIYLKASVETLVSRLEINRKKRPIVANLSDEELVEFIAKHLFDRSFYYNQCKYKVVVDDKSPSDVVAEIQKLLL
ncbi:MAG: shikimate kinase [Limnohabitans sp.]|nr:shikimate kinase [Limnohabitans sp.]